MIPKERQVAKLFLLIFVILFAFSTSQAANLINKNENGTFYAQLNNVKLSELTKSIKDSYGIEFKGQDDLFQTAISVSFENLKLEEMVKRILGGKNYVFTYNNRGILTEVTLLPTNKNEMKPRSINVVKSEKPPMPVMPPPDASQGTNLPVGVPPDSQPIKTDQDNKEGQAPEGTPSSQAAPNVALPGL
jgi:hypothetical protein